MQVFLKFVSNPVYSGQPYLGKYMPSSFIKFLFVSFEDDENISDYNKMISQNSKKKQKKKLLKSNFMTLFWSHCQLCKKYKIDKFVITFKEKS